MSATATITAATVADDLRIAMHGQNAPLNVQYTWLLLHALPRDIAKHPTSRDFRVAQRRFWAVRGLRFDATRTDVAAAIRYLDARGILPDWIVLDADRAVKVGG